MSISNQDTTRLGESGSGKTSRNLAKKPPYSEEKITAIVKGQEAGRNVGELARGRVASERRACELVGAPPISDR
ncbi:MAG: hypothetical protein ACRD04_03650 [Terriglobales bacterium]